MKYNGKHIAFLSSFRYSDIMNHILRKKGETLDRSNFICEN